MYVLVLLSGLAFPSCHGEQDALNGEPTAAKSEEGLWLDYKDLVALKLEEMLLRHLNAEIKGGGVTSKSLKKSMKRDDVRVFLRAADLKLEIGANPNVFVLVGCPCGQWLCDLDGDNCICWCFFGPDDDWTGWGSR